MSNWTTLATSDITEGVAAQYVVAAQSLASQTGCADPLPEMIADVVANIRSMISSGNTLDINPAMVPNSLKGLAKRMVIRSVKAYTETPLSKDESDQGAQDRSYLLRINDDKIQFEQPDTPGGSAEMQSRETVTILNRRRRETGRERQSGL
jgi:hypothetical protein